MRLKVFFPESIWRVGRDLHHSISMGFARLFVLWRVLLERAIVLIPQPIRARCRALANEALLILRLHFLRLWFRLFGLRRRAGETFKAKARRLQEGFFEKYCHGKGLDICYGGDLLAPNCKGWEWFHGDAHYLRGLKDHTFDFVHSSHALEHMEDPALALRNWWRVVKPGGYLILYIPHRDLLEQKITLPSKWNPDHKHFFLPDRDEPPHTIGLAPLIDSTCRRGRVLELKICDEGYRIKGPEVHPEGEYSIEAIIQKSS